MRIVFHNPHTSIWFKKPLYFHLTRRKCAVKYEYLLDYCVRKKVDYAFLCDGSDFSFARSVLRGRLLARLELILWCLFNKVNPFKTTIMTRANQLKKDDVLFSFLLGTYTHPYHDSDQRNINYRKKKFMEDLSLCRALKVVHVSHYMFDVKNGAANTKTARIDLFAAENNLTKNSLFFRSHYSWYVKDVYVLPFVAQSRFERKTDFDTRKNKAVATGTLLYQMKDRAFLSYFNHGELHPMRRTLFQNKSNIEDYVDCFIHETEENQKDLHSFKDNRAYARLASLFYNVLYRPFFVKQAKYFSFSIVDLYNSYKMFIVPEEILDLPSIGFVEGMACGAAYIGKTSPMYSEIGLIDGVHYIGYDGTLEDLLRKIEFYQKNQTKLKDIANEGHEFVNQRFNGDSVAGSLFDYLSKALQVKRSMPENTMSSPS